MQKIITAVRDSIRLKLILGVAFVHLILMTLFIYDLVERQKDFLIREAHKLAVSQAKIIADTASPWVIADDLVGMEEVVRSSAEGNSLRYAMLADPAGRVLAHTERDKIGKYLQDEVSHAALVGVQTAKIVAAESNTVFAAAPVLVDGQLLGWSLLGLDTTATNAHLGYVTRTGSLYTAIAIVVGTIFAILLARSILRQLSLLLSGVGNLGKNRLDEAVPIVTNDEVGKVASAFNHAVASLREIRSELDSEMLERKRAEQATRRLSRRLINTIEEERKRIAQDLHDEFGQALTGVQIGLNSLKNAVPADASAAAKCQELIESIQSMGDSIDRVASDLRPATLDHLGLVPAVKSYLEDFEQRTPGLEVEFHAVGLKNRLDSAIELVCYRVIQESLTNIVKHAKASRAEIQITVSHPKVIVTIKDNGIGFDQQDAFQNSVVGVGGVGLSGMQERVASVRGTLEARRQKGGGSMVRVKLPTSLGKPTETVASAQS